MTRKDYEEKIIECLSEQNGGCIDSIRKLIKKGTFNSTRLRIHLDRMIDKGMISEQNVNGKKQICLVDDYGLHKEYKKIKHNLERLDTLLKRNDLGLISKLKIVTEIVNLSTRQIRNAHAHMIYADIVDHDREKVRIFEKEMMVINNNLKRVIMTLKNKDDRARMIDLMFVGVKTIDVDQFREHIAEFAEKGKPMKKRMNIRFHGK